MYCVRNLLRCEVSNIDLCGCDHVAAKCCEKVDLPSPVGVIVTPFFTSTQKTEDLTSYTPVPNDYSQVLNTQWPIVYYTWFTTSTLSVKSVFWHTHSIHVFLNTLKHYSQYSSTQWSIVYYSWFTVSTLSVKSVFWHTHTIHVFLNSPRSIWYWPRRTRVKLEDTTPVPGECPGECVI